MPGSGRSSIGVRIRPNAQGFINQLRADLQAKQYTFYVDVRARTNPATRDVREWAQTTLRSIQASVAVGADTTRASRELSQWRRQQGANAVTIPVAVDLTRATAQIEAWRRSMSRDLDIKATSSEPTGGNTSAARNSAVQAANRRERERAVAQDKAAQRAGSGSQATPGTEAKRAQQAQKRAAQNELDALRLQELRNRTEAARARVAEQERRKQLAADERRRRDDENRRRDEQRRRDEDERWERQQRERNARLGQEPAPEPRERLGRRRATRREAPSRTEEDRVNRRASRGAGAAGPDRMAEVNQRLADEQRERAQRATEAAMDRSRTAAFDRQRQEMARIQLDNLRRQNAEMRDQIRRQERIPPTTVRGAWNRLRDQRRGTEQNLDLDTTEARAEAAAFAATVASMSPEQRLKFDTTQARLEAAQLRQRIERNDVTVRVRAREDKGSIEAMFKRMSRANKQFQSRSIIRSLDFGPFTVGKPKGLTGTLTTLTALAGLVPAVATGVMALSDAFMRMAGAVAMLPGLIGGLAAALGTFAIGAAGVGDTIGAMFEMWGEGASDQVSAQNSLIGAQNAYRNAVIDEAEAQEAVADARREALGDLRDLNNELRGSALNEAQAILDLQKARDRYAQGGFENETDRMQAALDVAKAEQSLIEVREGNIDLQYRVNEANEQGVEGSDKVQDALEAQVRAAQATQQALAALTETQNNGTSAATKFSDAFGKLGPEAQGFIESLLGLKGPISDLRMSLQDLMFEGLGPAFTDFANTLLPAIQPGMEAVASSWNGLFKSLFDSLGSEEGQSILTRIFEGTSEGMDAFSANVLDPLIQSFGLITAAGAEHLPELMDMIGGLLDRFTNFLKAADADGSLDQFLSDGIEGFKDLVDTGVNLLQIVNTLGDAFGGDTLDGLARLTQQWEDFLNSEEGQAKLQAFLERAKELWAEWKPVLDDLPEIFGAVGDAAMAVLSVILPPLSAITGFLAEHPGLVQAFVGAWLAASVVGGVISTLGLLAGGLLTTVRGILTALYTMPAAAAAARTSIAATATAAGIGTASTVGRVAAVAGPVGIAAAAVAGPVLVGQQLASNTDANIANWNAERDAAPDDAARAEIDRRWSMDLFGVPEVAADAFVGGKISVAHETSLQQMSQEGNGVAQWVLAGSDPNDQARRYAWALKPENAAATGQANFTPPPSYDVGGYTDWDRKEGRMAILHGKEWIHNADASEYYGPEVMSGINQMKFPKEFFDGFHDGMDHEHDPNDPRLQNPQPGILDGVIQHGMSGINSMMPGATQTLGPLPGPAPTTSGFPGNIPLGINPLGTTPTSTTPATTLDMFGFQIPLGTESTAGWPGGIPPVGLGGGPDGFDIRNFGIGPGPAGSTPGDWMNFTGGLLGNFVSSAGSALVSGALGIFGLEGILGSPYFQGATGLLGHFLNPQQGGAAQDPNATATNASVAALMEQYYGMPMNPAYPGTVPQMPNMINSAGSFLPLPTVIDPATGQQVSALDIPSRFDESNLQPHTIATLRAVSAQFPGIANIGGFREDPLPDHPSGRGLDIMIPNYDTPEGVAYGMQVDQWLRQNASQLGIKATIWQNKWADFNGNTSTVPGHMNHIHVQMAKDESEIPTLEQVFGTSLPGVAQPTAPYLPGNAGYTGNAGSPITRLGNNLQYGSADAAARRPSTQVVPGPGQSLTGVNFSQLNSLLGSTPGGDTRGLRGAALKQVARQLYTASGMPPNEWGAFDQLMQHESGWNPTAQNPSSTAYGLGQFLDSTWSTVGGAKTDDPVAQLKLIFQYLKTRPDYQGSPAKAWALWNERQPHWYEQGGWLMPGQTNAMNGTGKPELVVPWDDIPAFRNGGQMPTGAVGPIKPPPPRIPDAQPIQPRPVPAPIQESPQPQIPAIIPQTPPPAPAEVGGGQATSGGTVPGPGGAQVSTAPRPTTGAGPGSSSMHLHPAAQKGITSGFAAAGNVASSIASMGAGGMGGMGGMISGLFGQAGKIATGIANVGASFLVGNITGGTTANPYGVTQRGNIPSGGTKMVDASNNQYGDIYTNNLDEFFARKRREDAQKAQAGLGRWGNA